MIGDGGKHMEVEEKSEMPGGWTAGSWTSCLVDSSGRVSGRVLGMRDPDRQLSDGGETTFWEKKAKWLTGVTQTSEPGGGPEITRGSLAFRGHADTLLALSDSGPGDERSKATSTDPGGVAPAEWRSRYTLADVLEDQSAQGAILCSEYITGKSVKASSPTPAVPQLGVYVPQRTRYTRPTKTPSINGLVYGDSQISV
ncbi:unnamed protein product [Pleuronectes platessa]|uniref:Uncharacterized protein n=1 Tax=Pleuronectes platessa TaxID=8262 RepID=A0A9N7UC66_PLEPL|nr:unnamed protein product [Pleuronectes platessa]